MARIVRAWRALTSPPEARRAGPGARTLIACSGGADSSALVLALATASTNLVVAHIVHDLRPRAEALADRDAAQGLAASLGLAFVAAEVSVRAAVKGAGGGRNVEARARRERYAALVRLAREHGCRFIATAHHADDQLETMLMAMLRGAGPRGMAGAAVMRTAGPRAGDVRIIRPMLGGGSGSGGAVAASTRADAEGICRAAGWVWREDTTNADTRLLRNALRRDVLPVLERLRPGASVRAARGAELLRGAAEVVRAEAVDVWGRGDQAVPGGKGSGENQAGRVWGRAELRHEPEIVLGEWLRLAAGVLAPADRAERSYGLDRLSRRAVAPVIRAIRDGCTDPREFRVGQLRVSVSARRVRVERVQS